MKSPTNKQLLELHSRYQRYTVANNRERGYDHEHTTQKQTEYFSYAKEIGLSIKVADMVCWYVHNHYHYIHTAAEHEEKTDENER